MSDLIMKLLIKAELFALRILGGWSDRKSSVVR